ncbi:MAG: hypothetical protein ABIZ80_03395 [Bryobacteraceae bacterium]
MNQPITKSSLPAPERRLVELMQRLNFGRIEHLRVQAGTPVFDPPPRVVQKLKMGGDNGPRGEALLPDFWLKTQMAEMLAALADLGDGEILAIEVKNGLPFSLEIEQPQTPKGNVGA